MTSMPAQPEMEKAHRQQDESYHGIFSLGVPTTGIFCKPSCPAKSDVLARQLLNQDGTTQAAGIFQVRYSGSTLRT